VAFVVGIVLYILDGLLLAWAQDWLSVGIHALALFYLFRGLQANMKFHKMEQEQAQATMSYSLR
jgi:hypothetical protein